MTKTPPSTIPCGDALNPPLEVQLAQQNDRLRRLVAELIRKNEELRQRLAVATGGAYPHTQGWA